MSISHIWVFVFALASACMAEGNLPPTELGLKRNDCGGTITSDSDIVDYPGPTGNLIPGELCTWTIHLNTTQNFLFNFTYFDLRSISPSFDCSDMGVRIYSLSPVSSGGLESYTFCSDNPPPTNLTISGNLIQVIVYSNNFIPSGGFIFHFEGVSDDELKTTHLSTFTTNPSGLIGYPVGEQYSQSVTATWTIDILSADNSTAYVDVDILSVGLQTCANPDPCTCDSLVVYEISDGGILSVRERFCSSATNSLLSNAPGRFVIAFISDSVVQPGDAGGFQLQYTPSAAPPTTPKPDTDIPCGTFITDKNTEISYKESVQYGENERCVWVVQVPKASNYRLQVLTYGVTNARDGLSMSGYQRQTSQFHEETHVTSEGVYEVRGDIAIITFHTSSGASGFGFTAKITGLFYFDRSLSYSANYVFTNPNPFTFTYPSSGDYGSNEFSHFIYAPESRVNPGVINRAALTNYMADYCDDRVDVFFFSEATGNGGIWLQDQRICEYNGTNHLFQSRDIMLFRFESDYYYGGQAFTIDFESIPV